MTNMSDTDDDFDPDAFMTETYDEANDISYEPIPAGEYQATVDKINLPKGRKTKAGEPMYPLEVTWHIQDEDVAQQLGRDKLTCRQTIFLDLKGKALDMGKGKNIGLGQLRDALGLNGEGFTLKSLEGAGPATVVIKQTPDKQDSSIIRSNVVKVAQGQ